jgi:MoxR-like ATPase
MKQQFSACFPGLGVFGFDAVEPVILAALVSGDPILLIGKAGTGKTYLLNSISEAMGLEHRHYNASLISFDDLIGFPYPKEDGSGIRFLPTPATIWEAESVLVDELSRCKPEIQNKFFSIVHERKIQGIPLEKLRYRWAAMNPFSFGSEEGDDRYAGSEALEQALADRFAFIVEVPDWGALSKSDQEKVIDPAGEGAISNDRGQLKRFVEAKRQLFAKQVRSIGEDVTQYCRLCVNLMLDASYRLSPRRARQMARNIIALRCVADSGNTLERGELFKLALTWSLPQRAWKGSIPQHTIDAVHAEAFRLALRNDKNAIWASDFMQKTAIRDKVHMLFREKCDSDTRSLAVLQFLHHGLPWQTAAFAFTAFPLIEKMQILNADALQEVAGKAIEVLHVNGKLSWTEYLSKPGNGPHPQLSECQKYVSALPKRDTGRKKRALQLFLYLLTKHIEMPEAQFVETDMHACFLELQKIAKEKR